MYPKQATNVGMHGLQELLTAALSHFEAWGQGASSARAWLALAQLEQLGNQPQSALQLLQLARKAGGSVQTCCRVVWCYAEVACQLGKWADAEAALQDGIEAMNHAIGSVPRCNGCLWPSVLQIGVHRCQLACSNKACCSSACTAHLLLLASTPRQHQAATRHLTHSYWRQ